MSNCQRDKVKQYNLHWDLACIWCCITTSTFYWLWSRIRFADFFFVRISKKNKIFFLCNPVELDSYFVNVVESLLLFPIQVKKWITLVCVVQLRLLIHKIWSLSRTLSGQNRAVFCRLLFLSRNWKKCVTFIKSIYLVTEFKVHIFNKECQIMVGINYFCIWELCWVFT